MLHHLLLSTSFDGFCRQPQRSFTRALRTQQTAKLRNVEPLKIITDVSAYPYGHQLSN
jgi:hypothetical protein